MMRRVKQKVTILFAITVIIIVTCNAFIQPNIVKGNRTITNQQSFNPGNENHRGENEDAVILDDDLHSSDVQYSTSTLPAGSWNVGSIDYVYRYLGIDHKVYMTPASVFTIRCGAASTTITVGGNPPTPQSGAMIITGSNDLVVQASLGLWRDPGIISCPNNVPEGTYIKFTTNDGDTGSYINSNDAGVYSQSSTSHAYTFDPATFDGYYDMDTTYYMQIYVLIVDNDAGDGSSWLVPDSNGKYARHVATIALTFSNYKIITNPTMSLDTSIPGAEFYTGTVSLGGTYHGVIFSGIPAEEISRLQVRVSTSDPWTLLASSIVKFKDFASVTSTLEGGYSSIQLRYDLRPWYCSPSPFFINTFDWHDIFFTIGKMIGTTSTILTGSIIYSIISLSDASNPFKQEGLVPAGLAVGDDPFKYIRGVYTIPSTFADGIVSLAIGTDPQVLVAGFIFKRQVNVPSTPSIRFNKVGPRTMDGVDYNTLDVQTTFDSTHFKISWKNLPTVSSTGNDGSSWINPSIASRMSITVPATIGSSTLLETRLLDSSGTQIGTYGNTETKFFVNGRGSTPGVLSENFVRTARFESIYNRAGGATLYDFNIVIGMSTPTGGSLSSSKNARVIADITVPVPTGSVTSVFFESADLSYQEGTILDRDGTFLLKSNVAIVNGESGYDVDITKHATSTNGIVSTQTKTVDYPGATSLLTVPSADFMSLFDVPGVIGTYRFVIRPYYLSGGTKYYAPSINFGDTPATEKADGSNDGVKIIVFDYAAPLLRFWDETSAIPDQSITSTTGVTGLSVTNYVPGLQPYLIPTNPVQLQQRVSGSIVATLDASSMAGGISWYSYRSISLANINGYPGYTTVPSGSLLDSLYDLQLDLGEGSPFLGITGVRRMIDGTYDFRARFNYVSPYAPVSSISDRQFIVSTKRSLTVNGDPFSTTSYTGQFTLQWNQFNVPSSDVFTVQGKARYIMLFGRSTLTTVSSFETSDLTPGSIDTDIKMLGRFDSTTGLWNPTVLGSETTQVTISDDGTWGSYTSPTSGSVAFTDATPATYYFVVVPVYPVLVDSDSATLTGKYDWYQGNFSNVVSATINKQIFTTFSVSPFTPEGINRVIYTQGIMAFTADGVASGTIDPLSVSVELFYDRYGDGTKEFVTFSLAPVGGAFVTSLDIFDDLDIRNPSETIGVEFIFTFIISATPVEVRMNDGSYLVKTGINAVITYLSPGPTIPVVPEPDSSGMFLFSVETMTGISEQQKGLPNYAVDSIDIIISSVTVPGLSILPDGTPTSDGVLDKIPSSYNWELELYDLYDLAEGPVTITIKAIIDDGNLVMAVTGSFTFTLVHGSTIVMLSPALPPSKIVTIASYDPLNITWISYFGAAQAPDAVAIQVTRTDNDGKNVITWFQGMVLPSGLEYSYVINPLDHDMTDRFTITIVSTRGDKAYLIYQFKVILDFKVFIEIDPSALNYDSDDPPVGYVQNYIIAWADIEYPVSYYYYYLDFGQIIAKQNWYVERVNGSVINNALREPVNLVPITGRVAGLLWPDELIPSTMQVDRVVFTAFRAPMISKTGVPSFSNNGTVYSETVLLQSNNYFSNINVNIVPTYTSFTPSTLERWNVTVNGVQVTNFTVHANNTVTVHVDGINPGQSIPITVTHYYTEEPPVPPPETIWDQIVAFFASIITAILALLGIAVAMTRRVNARSRRLPVNV